LHNQETPVAAKSPSTDDFEWLSCGDFMDYLGSISTYTGTSVKAFSVGVFKPFKPASILHRAVPTHRDRSLS
jgi:hypothetical protein